MASQGIEVQALKRQPELDQRLLTYIDTFFELGTDRVIGYAVGPIPYTTLDTFARRAGLEGEAFQVFVTLIRSCDTAYLTEIEKRTKRNAGRS